MTNLLLRAATATLAAATIFAQPAQAGGIDYTYHGNCTVTHHGMGVGGGQAKVGVWDDNNGYRYVRVYWNTGAIDTYQYTMGHNAPATFHGDGYLHNINWLNDAQGKTYGVVIRNTAIGDTGVACKFNF